MMIIMNFNLKGRNSKKGLEFYKGIGVSVYILGTEVTASGRYLKMYIIILINLLCSLALGNKVILKTKQIN